MKTMYFPISVILIFLAPFFLNQVQAYDGIEIQNIQVLPRGDIIAGHPIKINVTLVNNSPNPILVSQGACDSPFSVTFDNHVLVKNNNIFCTLQLLVHRLDPGKSMTATSPGPDLLYLGAYGGTVNASVTFPYKIWNPSNQTYDKENATKLFSFEIYNRTKMPTLSQPERQAVIDAALAVPGLQNWSHDWQFSDMAFMTENNRPDIWRYAVVYLRAPSSSTPLHCNHDSYAMITVDMTTMKVVDSTYPTMESYSCLVSVGGGPGTLGGTVDGETKLSSNTTSMKPPLQQFKSGIESKDVKCYSGYVLVIKAEDGSPACVRPEYVGPLYLRGWSGGPFPENVVFVIKPYSEGKIFAKFVNQSPNLDLVLYPELYEGFTRNEIVSSQLLVSQNPNNIPHGKTLVSAYNIMTKNISGLYWLRVAPCEFIPIFVQGFNSQIHYLSDIQNFLTLYNCSGSGVQYHIVGTSGIGTRFVPYGS